MPPYTFFQGEKKYWVTVDLEVYTYHISLLTLLVKVLYGQTYE